MGSLLKGDSGQKPLAGKLLPRIDVGHRSDCQNIEARSDEQCHGDGLEEILRGKSRLRFLRCFWDRLESGDEVRDDLQRKQDGNEGRMAEVRFEIWRGTARG